MVISVLLVSCSKPNITARFGEIEITERVEKNLFRFGFFRELDKVPLLTMNQGGLYGIEYRANDDKLYQVELTAVVPKGVFNTRELKGVRGEHFKTIEYEVYRIEGVDFESAFSH